MLYLQNEVKIDEVKMDRELKNETDVNKLKIENELNMEKELEVFFYPCSLARNYIR